MEQNVGQKCQLIENVFVEGLFGHIGLPSAFWSQLDLYCDSYFPVIDKLGIPDEFIARLESVVTDHPLLRFPVAYPHLSEVINWLDNSIRRTWPHKTVSKRIRELCNLSQNSLQYPAFIFKSLDRSRNGHRVITLLEETEIIGHGTTGLTSWQGALFLTDWILSSFRDELKGTRILEVGCGVGFLGLHVVKSLPDVASYTFTDGHPEVIKFVNYNIDLNFPSIQKTRSDESQLRSHMHSGPPDVGNSHPISSGCALIVDQLDWTKDHMRDYTVDWILGADVVYERSLIAPLCGVLRRLLKANQSAKALIACTERSATTLKCFEAALTDSGLGYTIIARGSFTPADNILCSDVKHQLTRVYSIK